MKHTPTLSLCPHCMCMTKTVIKPLKNIRFKNGYFCGKCGEIKKYVPIGGDIDVGSRPFPIPHEKGQEDPKNTKSYKLTEEQKKRFNEWYVKYYIEFNVTKYGMQHFREFLEEEMNRSYVQGYKDGSATDGKCAALVKQAVEEENKRVYEEIQSILDDALLIAEKEIKELLIPETEEEK